MYIQEFIYKRDSSIVILITEQFIAKNQIAYTLLQKTGRAEDEDKNTSMRHMYCMRFVEVFLVIAFLNRVQIGAISLKQGYKHSPVYIEKNGDIWYIFHYMEKGTLVQ